MKSVIKSLFAIFLLSITFSACQKKNNDMAKSLDGQWEITKITKGNGVVDESSMPEKISLISCNVRKEDCSGVWVSKKGDLNNFFWTISEKGELLTIMTEDSQVFNQASSDLAEYKGIYVIVEIRDNKMVINRDNITMEFKK
ncbi:MAG: hypothetical protein H0X62_10680 [Bacteroidetes bacterium]|nr:hypothetical protein [Bacteroidota bacterium]